MYTKTYFISIFLLIKYEWNRLKAVFQNRIDIFRQDRTFPGTSEARKKLTKVRFGFFENKFPQNEIHPKFKI